MKTEINEKGIITISAETPLEAFALNKITKKWNNPEDMHNSILIETGLDFTDDKLKKLYCQCTIPSLNYGSNQECRCNKCNRLINYAK